MQGAGGEGPRYGYKQKTMSKREVRHEGFGSKITEKEHYKQKSNFWNAFVSVIQTGWREGALR